MSKIETMRDILYHKMQSEQQQYFENMKKQSPEEIIRCAYEKVMRDEIVIVINADKTLTERQLKALMQTDNLVGTCYNEWLENDYSFGEVLRDTIAEYADNHANYLDEKNKKRQEPER